MRMIGLFFIVVVGLAWISKADGPLFKQKDTYTQQEFDNTYQDLRKKISLVDLLRSTNSWTAAQNFSSATVSNLTANTIISSNTGNFFKLNTNTLLVDGTNNRVFVGTDSASYKFYVKGGNAANFGIDNTGQQFTEFDLLNNGLGRGQLYYDNSASILYLDNVVSGSGGVEIRGTKTNDNASAGFYGEYMSSACANNVTIQTSAQYFDVCYQATVVLTPGDWDINGTCYFVRNGATYTGTGVECGIGTATGNNSAGVTLGDTDAAQDNATANTWSNCLLVTPIVRKSISTTTTYFLKGYPGTFTGSPFARGRISARRVR